MNAQFEEALHPRPLVRVATLATLVGLAAMLVVAARWEPAGMASRSGRRVQLVELIGAEQARAAELRRTVEELSAEVAAYERQGAKQQSASARLQRQADQLLAYAGMTAVRGPGLIATLTDSPLAESPTGDLNDLVIHEQDLQAVINALWAGGAEAVSVNGQRVLATTAIRCVGNTLLLHGRVYSPPYVIAAIGDEMALTDALDRDPVVERFRSAARQYSLGFSLVVQELTVPAYDGSVTLLEARPRQSGAS